MGGNGAADVSWDGRVVVGIETLEGFRDENGIRTWLGDLPGGAYLSEAFAVSPDGSLVVGYSTTVINSGGTPREIIAPMRWTEAEGRVALAPSSPGQAFDVSESKLVIVGIAEFTQGFATEAFRWTPARGIQSIRQLLLDEGINVAQAGWALGSAVAVSANGRIIVGDGIHNGKNEPWLTELFIPGDFDDNGISDGNDFLIWQRGLGTTYDASDLADWRTNIEFSMRVQLSSAATTTSAVPEPSVMLAVIVPALMVLKRRTLRSIIDG